MNRSFLLAMGLVLVAPAALAQTAQLLDSEADQARRHQEMMNRELQNARQAMEQGERQAWFNSIANMAKLRIKLAEAWQNMGMSPQGAKLVADAYDPEWAMRIHHEPLRGKSDEEVAGMLQSALRQQHYLVANQLLIDYQRDKLRLGARPSM